MLKKPKLPANAALKGSYWPEGLTPFPFQLAAVDFLCTRLDSHRAAYLAADPGLGKTIVAAILKARLGSKKTVYVCPPSLIANVEAEFKKWGHQLNMPVIVPDTRLADAVPIAADLIFIDEAHRFKNEKAQRTRGLFSLISKCPRVVLLSGTPSPNSRPVELWVILKNLAPDVFGTAFFPFAKRYCNARKEHFGWKFDGFTNKADFKQRLFRSFMLRQKKSLIELPPKREGLLTVGEGIPPIIGNLEKKVLDAYTVKDLVEGRLTAKAGKTALHLAEYLRLLGEEKLKYVFPFIEHLLLETKENLIIFAHHKGVINGLAEFLAQFNPVVIAGGVPSKARHALVQKFQTGKTRVAILNIVAAGIGWNMTAADRVLFVEFSWRDGDNEQAGDRAHRIGREKPVLVQYVVLKDSFDAKRMNVVLRKRHCAV